MPGKKLLMLAFLLLHLAGPAVAEGPGCAPPREEAIELLPRELQGSTVGLGDRPIRYASGSCPIPDRYEGGEAVYRLRLHPGNRVGFQLIPQVGSDPTRPDLVLAVLGAGTAARPCVASSQDLLGSAQETISARSYPPGDYLVVVDSIDRARGGAYRLRITGTNPLPDLAVQFLDAPAEVVAGTDFGYRLEVRNRGSLPASSVTVVSPLPAGAKIRPPLPAGCSLISPREVRCTLGPGSLAPGASRTTGRLNLRLDPAARGDGNGRIFGVAQASACEADAAPADNLLRQSIRVRAEANLVTRLTALPEPFPPGDASGTAVAGRGIEYKVAVSNRGPSTATGVQVQVSLPAATCSPAGACQPPPPGGPPLRVDFPVGTLPPGQEVEQLYRLAIHPAARDRLIARADARAIETDPVPADNTRVTRVVVRAVADLALMKHASATEVVAGRDLTYRFEVRNAGPSDGTGVVICDALEPRLSFLSSSPNGCCLAGSTGCSDACGAGDGRPTVQCRIERVEPGELERRSFKVKVGSARRAPIENRATVAVGLGEEDPVAANDSASTLTGVRVEADLELSASGLPAPVAAGTNMFYTLVVKNRGHSDTGGGSVSACLPEETRFVASPEDCCRVGAPGCTDPGSGSLDCPSSRERVVCTLGELTPEEAARFRLVAAVDPAAEAGTSLSLSARITARASFEIDPDPGNNQKVVTTGVIRQADLAVHLADEPDPVLSGGSLVYTLAAENLGPSDAGTVVLSARLAPGFVPLTAECLPVYETTVCTVSGQEVVCEVNQLALRAEVRCSVTAMAPAAPVRGPFPNTATATAASGGPTDPRPDNNTVEEETTVAEQGDSDLAVSLTGSADPVTGDLLGYTVRVRNRGPEAAHDVELEVRLDPEVEVLEFPTPDCAEEAGVVTCGPISEIPPGGEEERVLSVRVKPSAGPSLSTEAETTGAGPDPNPGNNQVTQSTAVLRVAPLVLPFFDAGPGPLDATTLFAVRNQTAEIVSVRYAFLPGEGGAVCRQPATVPLAGHAVRSVNLRDVCAFPPGSQSLTGAVEITPVGITPVDGSGAAAAGTRVLSGDFFLIGPGAREASGSRMVQTTTAGSSPELCQGWDLPLIQFGVLGASTDFLFFVPGASALSPPEALGRVYNETGQLVQEIRVEIEAPAWRRNSRADLDLLAQSGAIEWQLPAGVVGNISAVYKTAAGIAVGVPGACRERPGEIDLGPEPPLVVPYFEAGLGDPGGPTTLLAVHNGGEEEVPVSLEYCNPAGASCQADGSVLSLGAHATRFVNLREAPVLPVSTGFARVTLTGSGERRQRVLSGAYLRVEAGGRSASGEALVKTGAVPAELCRKWSMRLLHAGSSLRTEFVFYLHEPVPSPPAEVCGTLFPRNGGGPSQQECEAVIERSFTLASADFAACGPPGGAGSPSPCADLASVEWLLPVEGHVSAIYRNGSQVVMVPGTCLDQETP